MKDKKLVEVEMLEPTCLRCKKSMKSETLKDSEVTFVCMKCKTTLTVSTIIGLNVTDKESGMKTESEIFSIRGRKIQNTIYSVKNRKSKK